MPNEVNAIAALQPADALELCNQLARSAYNLGWWFIFLALVAAALHGIVVIAVGLFAKDDKGKQKLTGDPATWIDALKGLLQAFGALPTWAAMFVAGLALFWIAMDAPKRCGKQPPPLPETNSVNTSDSAAANTTNTSSAVTTNSTNPT